MRRRLYIGLVGVVGVVGAVGVVGVVGVEDMSVIQKKNIYIIIKKNNSQYAHSARQA